MVVAPAPDRPVDGGMPTTPWWPTCSSGSMPTACHCTDKRRCWSGKGSSCTTPPLANWIGRACWWLTPLYELMLSMVLASPKVFAGDTTLPVLDPDRSRTKAGRPWCYAVDDCPWRRPWPMAAYVYSVDRKNERPAGHLAAFRGVLQVDGDNGFKALARARADMSVTLAFVLVLPAAVFLRHVCKRLG